MKSQVVPYPNLKKHENARELILDCRMPVDDEVYTPPPLFLSLSMSGLKGRSVFVGRCVGC